MVKHFTGFVLLVVIVVACSFLISSYYPKQDETLIAEFLTNREAYQRSVSMLNEDALVEVSDQGIVRLDNGRTGKGTELGITQERLNEYIAVLKRLNIRYVFKNGTVITFASLSVKVSDTNDPYERFVDSKGIVYSENPLPVVDSLNSLGQNANSPIYRRIEGNWYLYRRWGLSKPE